MEKNFNCWDGRSKCKSTGCIPYSCSFVGNIKTGPTLKWTIVQNTAKPKNSWTQGSDTTQIVLPCNNCGDCYNVELSLTNNTTKTIKMVLQIINDTITDKDYDIPPFSMTNSKFNCPCNSILVFDTDNDFLINIKVKNV